MQRRTLLGVAAAVLVVGANAVVWFLQREPDVAPPDTRGLIRDQLIASWRGLPSAPLAEATEAIGAAIDATSDQSTTPDAPELRRFVSFRTLTPDQRDDLVRAAGDLVSAIGSRDAASLLAYARDRGLRPVSEAFRERAIAIGRPDATDLEELLADPATDPRWAGVVPAATYVRAWRPHALRRVSLMHLGRSAAWAWGNETVFGSLFASSPTFVQASQPEVAVLADVRVVIEYDESLDNHRGPCFFRFWLSDKDNRWRPIALKIVRTDGPPAGDAAPAIVF